MRPDELPAPDRHAVGITVGRFQVPMPHMGHLCLFHLLLDRHDQIMIFLGVAPIGSTSHDPLGFAERRAAILDSLEPSLHRRVTIVPIGDAMDDNHWSQDLDRKVIEFFPHRHAFLYGRGGDWIHRYSGIFEGVSVDLPATPTCGAAIRSAIKTQPIDHADFRAGIVYAAMHQRSRVDVTVDLAILRFNPSGTELLLGRKANEPCWRLPGGFVDIGDLSIERAALRELREEVQGLEILQEPRYAMSTHINDWRYRLVPERSILTALWVVIVGANRQPVTAGDDLHEVRWVKIPTSMVADWVKDQPIMDAHAPLINWIVQHHDTFKPASLRCTKAKRGKP